MAKKYILVLESPFQEEKNFPIEIQRRSLFSYRYILHDSLENATPSGLIQARVHLIRFNAASEQKQRRILRYRRGKGKLSIQKR